MAQRGFSVTGVDFIREALDFARKRAQGFGVNVDFVQCDVTEFESGKKFNLLLDCGCLHSFGDRKRIKYKEKILNLMSDRSEYVLLHFGKRDKADLGLGPRPKSRDEIEEFFLPELELVDFIPSAGGAQFYQYRFIHSHGDAGGKTGIERSAVSAAAI